MSSPNHLLLFIPIKFTSLRFETRNTSSSCSSPSSLSRNFSILSVSAVMVSDSEPKKTTATIKFLCSYGGKILPRSSDGKLRYVGGLTRVLAVDRSISFSELMVRLGEFCGYSVELKCQLPNGDLETLISIKSEEELANLIEEYDRSCPGSKIRAVLSPPKSLKVISPPLSTTSSLNASPTKKSTFNAVADDYRRTRCYSPLVGYKGSGTARYYPGRGIGNRGGLFCYDPRCYSIWH